MTWEGLTFEEASKLFEQTAPPPGGHVAIVALRGPDGQWVSNSHWVSTTPVLGKLSNVHYQEKTRILAPLGMWWANRKIKPEEDSDSDDS